MQYDKTASQRATYARTDAPVSTGNPFWDMMLSFGKASQQAAAGYGAVAERGVAHRTESSVEVIPVGEETLNVGTRAVSGETTRVRRVVVETPVEQEVSLREERVVVERRKPTAATAATTQGILTETAVEMSDSYEVVEVWKSVRVTEEVVLRREATVRTETVRDTVRRDEVTVEHARPTLPAPRRQAEPARKLPAQPKAEMPEPEKLAADLKKVAERFEADAPKAEQKAAAPQPLPEPPKAVAEPAKSTVEPPKATTEQSDKGGPGRKA